MVDRLRCRRILLASTTRFESTPSGSEAELGVAAMIGGTDRVPGCAAPRYAPGAGHRHQPVPHRPDTDQPHSDDEFLHEKAVHHLFRRLIRSLAYAPHCLA